MKQGARNLVAAVLFLSHTAGSQIELARLDEACLDEIRGARERSMGLDEINFLAEEGWLLSDGLVPSSAAELLYRMASMAPAVLEAADFGVYGYRIYKLLRHARCFEAIVHLPSINHVRHFSVSLRTVHFHACRCVCLRSCRSRIGDELLGDDYQPVG